MATQKRTPKDDTRTDTRPEPAPAGGVAQPENTGGADTAQGSSGAAGAPARGEGGDDGGGDDGGGEDGGEAEQHAVRMFSPGGSPAAPLIAPQVNPTRQEHRITSPAMSAVMGEDHRRIVDDEGNEVTDLGSVLVKGTELGSVRYASRRLWSESSVPGAPGARPRRRLLYGEGAPVPEYEYERQVQALRRATSGGEDAAPQEK